MRTALAGLVVCFCVHSVHAGGTVLEQGLDYWHTPPGGASLLFGGLLPPIPADFFNPGSEPFVGTVQLQGDPIGPATGNADTVIRRLSDSPPMVPGEVLQVPIELVELRLVSTMPILVQPGNQPWDVRITYAPPEPGLGQAQLQLDSPAGGAMGYAMQFRPTIVFTPSGGGPPLTLELPPSFIQPALSEPAPFTTLPPPVILEQQGPNLFPTGPMTFNGPGYIQQVVPADPLVDVTDCNANGQDDAIDLALGVSMDSNRNGIPDECEIVISVLQHSFPDGQGGFALRFSNHGAIRITVPQPAPGQIGWINVSLTPTSWDVQNFPVHFIEGFGGGGDNHSFIIPVPLPTPSGAQLGEVPVILTYTPAPLSLPPLPGPIVPTVPVTEVEIDPGMLGPITVLLPSLPDPGPIGPFINPFIPVIWETVSRSGVPGVDEATNHCAPGAAARSVAWLNDHYCIDLPDDCDTAQELYDMLRDMDHMDTTEADGTDSIQDMVDGIQQLLEDKGLDDDFTVDHDADTSGDAVFENLQKGYDVLGLILWRNADGTVRFGHVITVVGATRCGENVTIDYRDDAHGTDDQGDGDADSDDTKGGKIVPNANGTSSLDGHARNTWEGTIRICPTRKRALEAAMKWDSGDTASGGSVDGVSSLLQEILDGHEPTIAELLMLLTWACNLESTACATLEQIIACGTLEMVELAQSIKADATAAKIGIVNYILGGDDSNLQDAADAVNADFDDAITALLALLDCDGNGIDDKLDIARGDLHDANNDMVPDECQCLADWNSDGEVNVPDIFAFLSAWFAGNADANHDGTTNVPDIFFFLSLWFAGCPD